MIFIDTGAWLARLDARDQYHRVATERWKRLERSDLRPLTSNLVLAETLTLLARRQNYEYAARQARAIYASTVLDILRPDREQDIEAIDFFEKYADQQVSFTDCVSFALMRRHGINEVFGFDRHFEQAGFALWQP